MSVFGYQYVVLRCVPEVQREEFLNVGVVVYSQAADYLEAVAASLETICQVCRGVTGGGLPTLGGLGRRFGWLSAPRSTVVQPSPVHGGLTVDPAAELHALVDRLVG